MLSSILMMLAVGAVMGLILGVSAKVFYVAVDERVSRVTELLPGYNCGGCGYPGCSGMAGALISKEVDAVSVCKPSNVDQRTAIVEYLKETPGPDGNTLTVKM